MEDFEKTANDFLIEDISIYKDEKIINNFIEKLFQSENIIPTIFYHLNLFLENYKDKMKNIEHINIILVGPAGTGKSTLINSILNVNAPEGFGAPVTNKEEYYFSKEVPFLRLADSKGIEKLECGVDKVFESIQDFIKKQIKEKDPDRFIHCIWYCWCSTRLEGSEVELLNKLSSQYSLETIPIIIVYTNAIDPDQVINARKYISETLKLKNDFIEILAREKKVATNGKVEIIYPFNLDKLIELSLEKARNALKSSCYEGLFEDIKFNTKNKIEELMEILKEKNNSEAKEIISNLKMKGKIEYLQNELINIITKLFYQYFFLYPDVKIIHNQNTISSKLGELEYSISETTKTNIKEFVFYYFKLVINSYHKNLKILIENYSNILSNEILKFQNDFIKNNNNKLDIHWTITELKIILSNYINENISTNIELYALKNAFSFIITPLIEKFGEFFYKIYLQIIEKRKEFKEKAYEITKVSFDLIEHKIKEYNDLQKEKKEEEMKKMKINSPPPPCPPQDSVDNSIFKLLDDYDKKEEENINQSEENKNIIKKLENEEKIT